MKDRSDAHAILSFKKPWANNDNSIWLATTLRLHRNVEKFPFPGKLDDEQRKQIRSLTTNSIVSIDQLQSPLVALAEEMEPIEKEYLFEHYLSMQSFHQAHYGEAFVIDTTGEFLAVINIRDHLQLQITDCRGELEESWNRLVGIDTALGTTFNYAFSTKFGFLTADPTLCGTGLVVYVFLHLPALIHTERLHDEIEKNTSDDIATTGIQGDMKSLIGDVVTLHNRYTLGLTEEDIITGVRTAVTKMLVAEKSARAELRDQDSTEVMDRVSRAFGLLRNAYQLETVEAMNSLSLLKLGVDLGWIEGITLEQLNDLFFNCRHAHLIAQFKKPVDPNQVPHRRAELVHTALKPAKLNT